MKRVVTYWRWRFAMWRWRTAPFTLAATVVWPDMEPLLPASKSVKSHTWHYRSWSPWRVIRAQREWEAERG